MFQEVRLKFILWLAIALLMITASLSLTLVNYETTAASEAVANQPRCGFVGRECSGMGGSGGCEGGTCINPSTDDIPQE